jgi:prepilin-type N-terminal cleavage/methylation domain-containing protein
MSNHSHTQGFSLIEIIVSVVIAGIVFIGLFTSLTNIFSISQGSLQRTTASTVAYDNLRYFASGVSPLWFTCDTSDQTATQTLLDTTGPVDNLPGDVTQTVTASAVYGCDGAAKGFPIRVESVVTVNNGIEVHHATYTSF